MAVVHTKKAGQWAKRRARWYQEWAAGAMIISLLCIGGVCGFFFGRYQWVIAQWLAIFALAGAFLIMRLVFKRTDAWQRERIKYLRGAQAEAFVAWYLQDLSNSWHVFNNLPCAQGGDVDHVVVGPGGLFVISTKSYKGYVTRSPSGTICLNGKPMSDLDEAMRLALWVRDRLKATLGDRVPWVQPVLALPHASIAFPPTETPVWVVDDKSLLTTVAPEKPKLKLAATRVTEIEIELSKDCR
jgi:hypothetical protein